MTHKLRRIALAATAVAALGGSTIVSAATAPAKHGKRIATNAKNGKTYVVTGWVPASAFC
ncbi:MAG TPA: hypothetical protein VFY32_08990 [Solirubrobacteraceae bacterium]|nr:hypothetical protein [Solirubrobacteraceae bacterium]